MCGTYKYMMILTCLAWMGIQVWDLLAAGGKKEVELVKATSGTGFNIPDLAQIGASSNLPLSHEIPIPLEACILTIQVSDLQQACTSQHVLSFCTCGMPCARQACNIRLQLA